MVEKTVLKTKKNEERSGKNEERSGKSEINLTEEERLTAEWLRYLYLKHGVEEKVKKRERPPNR
jgi:hypothetical protein